MRLPGRPNCVIRWLMQSTAGAMRMTLSLAILTAAWGASVPGWSHPAMTVTAILLLSWGIGIYLQSLATWHVQRRGHPLDEPPEEVRNWRRKLRRAVVICLILVLVRPTMYARFWLSYRSLAATARALEAVPFNHSTADVDIRGGLYTIHHYSICPHGVKLGFDDRWSDERPGFIHVADDSSECTRFHRAWPMGGGWYASN